jgi:glycine betaine/choline ABC-type transport system substrate-binding protein
MRPVIPRSAACLFVSVLLVAGCSETDPSGGGIVIGSKNFSEQVILGEVLATLIEEQLGLPVTRRLNLGGTFICHKALVAGEIDLYVEYTGTALTAILKQPPEVSPEEAYGIVREVYRDRFGALWTEPLGFNNTFALIVRPEVAREHGLRRISDLSRVQDWLRPGFGFEFIEREDGFPGLAERYGLAFAQRPLEMELGLIYRALAEREVDLIAGSSTDGVIASLGLVALEDDRRYFPPYDAVPVVRQATLDRHPGLRGLLARLGGAISEPVMRRMNFAVDGGLRDPREVAREFVATLPAPYGRE